MSAPPGPVIVIPDGLAWDAARHQPRAEPSFVFRAVLDFAARNFREREILIAPANNFGGPVSEQAAAAAYLSKQGIAATAPPSEGDGYIDTMGNARQLRRFLARQDRWPLAPAELVVAQPHARRALLCFRRSGFSIAAWHAVGIGPAKDAVPPRLFYYRFPILHAIYETVALVRDRLRPAGNGDT